MTQRVRQSAKIIIRFLGPPRPALPRQPLRRPLLRRGHRGFLGACRPLLGRHGRQAALAADPAAPPSDLPQDLAEYGPGFRVQGDSLRWFKKEDKPHYGTPVRARKRRKQFALAAAGSLYSTCMGVSNPENLASKSDFNEDCRL